MPSFGKNEINARTVESMDVKALQALLREDFERPGGVLDVQLRILAVQMLHRREKESGVAYPDAEASLANFRQRYGQLLDTRSDVVPMTSAAAPAGGQGAKRRGHRRVHNAFMRSAAAIVAVVMLFAVSALAGGPDTGDRVARWTDDEFWMDFDDIEYGSIQQGSEQVHPQLEKMRQQLSKYVDDPEKLLPSYLPDGFVMTDIKASGSENDLFTDVTCWLTDGDRSMVLMYKIQHDHVTPSGGFSKDVGAPEEYVRNGITHYLLTNCHKYFAVWMNGNVECSIFNVKSHDEMIKIVDSIYGGVK